jgi:DNA-binding CsgD family transcriptional regulator
VHDQAGTPGHGVSSLSPREAEVLTRLARGYSNGEIARDLRVTVHAVKFHLGSIYRKLQVSNRTAAAAVFLGAVAWQPSDLGPLAGSVSRPEVEAVDG